jgi:hypothetical protein
MNKSEIKKMIRKLSRRRHNLLKHLIVLMDYPLSNAKAIQATKNNMQNLNEELNNLLVRLSK